MDDCRQIVCALRRYTVVPPPAFSVLVSCFSGQNDAVHCSCFPRFPFSSSFPVSFPLPASVFASVCSGSTLFSPTLRVSFARCPSLPLVPASTGVDSEMHALCRNQAGLIPEEVRMRGKFWRRLLQQHTINGVQKCAPQPRHVRAMSTSFRCACQENEK